MHTWHPSDIRHDQHFCPMRSGGVLCMCLCTCAFQSESVNQMKMNQCSWLGLIKARSPSHRCGCTLCPRQTDRQTVRHTNSHTDSAKWWAKWHRATHLPQHKLSHLDSIASFPCCVRYLKKNNSFSYLNISLVPIHLQCMIKIKFQTCNNWIINN